MVFSAIASPPKMCHTHSFSGSVAGELVVANFCLTRPLAPGQPDPTASTKESRRQSLRLPVKAIDPRSGLVLVLGTSEQALQEGHSRE